MARRAAKPETETWQPKNEWHCLSCDEQEGRSPSSMMEHLRGAHGLKEPIKGDKRMDLHMDCEGHYISNYTWTIAGEIKAAQVIVGPRRG